MRTLNRICACLCVAAAFATAAGAAQLTEGDPAKPHVWQSWGYTFTSGTKYKNPYADVTLSVTYTGPAGRKLRAYGFWDGEDTFRIRCAFPLAGEWSWETECSDRANNSLHQQRGSVQVVPYTGTNTLYKRGFLTVSDDRRHLAYGDKTPFLWMGDTAWAAPHKATEEEWSAYLADRVGKGFTLVQIGPASRWAGERNREGQRAFTDKACGQWVPAYWQSYERMVQRANDAGLMVLMVGLMEPVNRYPDPAAASLFARNIIARLYGNFVIFSPSFDSVFMPLGNQVGRVARDATTVHLITQHPGTPSGSATPTFAQQYYDESYLDIAAVQTGHNEGRLDRCAAQAINWPLHLYRHEPHKPVVNIEAMYDARGSNAWRAVDARSLGWRSWLSGSLGYTYGAGDVPPKVPNGRGALWNWSTNSESYDYWRNALRWESAFQMQHLRDFFAALPWWKLVPAHELIASQPNDVTRRMVLARSSDLEFAVAYLPDNEFIEIDLSAFRGPLHARWFDPVKGTYLPIERKVENGRSERFPRPAPGDWVLLVASETRR